MAPPLAGKPPFATDKPDSYYTNSSPQPRPRPPKATTNNNNKHRSTAYDVYDDYLDVNRVSSNRNSGMEGLGMGFMNGNLDDSDSEEDDEPMRRVPPSPSKNAALAAAVSGGKSKDKGNPFTPERFETPPPQYNRPPQPQQAPVPQPQTPTRPQPSMSPRPIAAPRPGYAAPIAALNQMQQVTRPQPVAQPAGRGPPANLRINASPYRSAPSPTTSPLPLQAPVTPITPVFARPQRTQTMTSQQSASVQFSETKGLIMRGEGEETLIPRDRGGAKGEQFWRRFSMVAKDPAEKGPSDWLKKNQGGMKRHNRWIWLIGIVLVILAAGGIGLGVYTSEKASAHYRPDAIGGSANDGVSALTTASSTSAKSAAKGAIKTTSSVPHVTPTNTVARRDDVPEPEITALVSRHSAHHQRRALHAHLGQDIAL